MWRLDGGGSAVWRDGDRDWSLQIAGGPVGIRLAKGDPAGDAASDSAGGAASDSAGGAASGGVSAAGEFGGDGSSYFSIGPAGSDRFPVLAEAFVRGDELHLDYPQGDGAYSVAVVCRVLESGRIEGRGGRLVTEWTIAIQTSRLESHPMLDLEAGGSPIRRLVPAASLENVGKTGGDPGSRRAAPITAVRSGGASVAILLDPRDFPWTLDLSDDHGLRQRLFGDFLEKGVIRKARPWVVIEETAGPFDEEWEAGEASDLTRRWHELCRTPLPLTA